MKPDWCPQEVWELVNALPIQSDGFCDDSDLETIARAILQAEQRGRLNGMKEAIAIALDRSPDDDNLDWQVRQQVAAVIRAKMEEFRRAKALNSTLS